MTEANSRRLRDAPSQVVAAIWHMPGRIWAGMMAVTVAAARFWSQVGAAMAWTVVFVAYGVVIWKGPWPLDRAQQQLDLLGQGQLFAGGIVLVIIVCLTGMRVDFSAGREGLRGTVDRDDDDSPATVVTTTTTKVATGQPSEPAADPTNGEERP